jgi:hypothetical protein
MMKIRALFGFFFLTILLLAGSTVWASTPAELKIDPVQCGPLPPPGENIVNVSTVVELLNAVNSASPGDTILVADGTYNLDGIHLQMDIPNVSVRSASGNREAVILDGNYITTEIFQIVASGVTVADLTLREAYDHPIHVSSTENDHTINTLIYNVHIIDPGQQAIKINPAASGSYGYYTDDGTIACSHIELTDAGRTHIRDNCYTGGIDSHQSRGWVIRDNYIEGFWCDDGLSEHGIHLWRGCRDTLIERNMLKDNARGIGLGLVTDGLGRTYPDDPCPSAEGYVDDFGGVIRNNFVSANDLDMFASEYGFDCGICLWNGCNAQALHNTVYTADPGSTFSSIEWRFENTQAVISNNLVNHPMRERDGSTGEVNGNLTTAQSDWFEDAAGGDLHLRSTAINAIDQATLVADVSDDFDGDPRPIGFAPDIGADEYGDPPPRVVSNLRVNHAQSSTDVITITLGWSPPLSAESQSVYYAHEPITVSNWKSATLLTGTLPGDASSYTALIPYTNGTLYFAHRSYNAAGGWSALSNNAYWPYYDIRLPIVMR